MNGKIKNLVPNRAFGFIVIDSKTEYFFHKDDFKGDWDNLVNDYYNGGDIFVTFEIVESPKGPRGSNVKRLNGDQE